MWRVFSDVSVLRGGRFWLVSLYGRHEFRSIPTCSIFPTVGVSFMVVHTFTITEVGRGYFVALLRKL